MNFRETIEEILLTENRIDFFKTQYVDTNKVSQKEFDAIIEGDPTPNKKYIGVLIKWLMFYKKPVKRELDKRRKEIDYRLFFEDLPVKIKSNLELHNRMSNKFKHSDIMKYETAEAFNVDGAHVKDNLDYFELQKGKQKKVVYEESLKIGETQNFNVYKIPKGRIDLYPASKFFASGTDWCTKGSDQFANYIKSDDLFIFINKVDPTEKYQLHIDEKQFADKFDSDLNLRNIPDYIEIVDKNFLCKLINSLGIVKSSTQKFFNNVKEFISNENRVIKTSSGKEIDRIEKELYKEVEDLYYELIDSAFEEISDGVLAKYEKVFSKETSKSLIKVQVPELYDYCENVLNIDMSKLLDDAEDMGSTFEWEEYNNGYYQQIISEGIDKCVIVNVVLPEMKKIIPNFKWRLD